MTYDVDFGKRRLMTVAAASAGLAITGVHAGESKQRTLKFPEYEHFDATGLAEQIRLGHLTPTEVLEAALDRANARQPLNAISLRHDERAIAKASAMSRLGQAERFEKSRQAPLWGVPFALKDLGVGLADTVTTNGCAFFKDAVATQDSTLVQRYLKAGLNVFAKTTTPEFGQTATTESKLFGLTRNPWNPTLSSGGSSGGAAVAVASGIIPMAHASDGGGSIRIPASHCGLFGLKPSRGRLPLGPTMMEGWLGLSMHHVISRSVRDSALMLELTQGAEPGSRTALPSKPWTQFLQEPPKRLRIALMEENLFGYPLHPDCLAGARHAAKVCESLGHQVEQVPKPLLNQALVGRMFAGMGVVTAAGMLYSVRSREALLGRAALEEEFESINWRSLQKAKTYSAEQILAARDAFDQVGRSLDLYFQQVDLILSPVTAAPPPPLGAMSLNQPYENFVKFAVMASPFTAMFNMSGHPAMSVPMHWNDAGIPIGAHFAGAYGAEGMLLSLASQLEQAAPWHHKRPVL